MVYGRYNYSKLQVPRQIVKSSNASSMIERLERASMLVWTPARMFKDRLASAFCAEKRLRALSASSVTAAFSTICSNEICSMFKQIWRQKGSLDVSITNPSKSCCKHLRMTGFAGVHCCSNFLHPIWSKLTAEKSNRDFILWSADAAWA